MYLHIYNIHLYVHTFIFLFSHRSVLKTVDEGTSKKPWGPTVTAKSRSTNLLNKAILSY